MPQVWRVATTDLVGALEATSRPNQALHGTGHGIEVFPRFGVRSRVSRPRACRSAERKGPHLHLLSVVAVRGSLEAGTALEVVPEALPADAAGRDPRAFRA